MAPKSKELLASVGLFLSTIMWGSAFVVIKFGIFEIEPVILVGYRFAIAALILGIILKLQGKNLFSHIKEGLILGLLLLLIYIPLTIGLKFTSASNSGFITGLFVVFIPIFSLLIFKKRSSWNQWGAVLVSVIGLWLLVGNLKQINFGDIITIIAAMAYAGQIIFIDRFVNKLLDPYVLSFQQFAVVGLVSLLLGLFFKLPFTINSSSFFWWVLYLAIFPSLVACVVQVVSQRFVDTLKTGLIFSLEPVFAAVFAWTYGKEYPTGKHVLGGFLIFISIIISKIYGKINQKSVIVTGKIV